MEKKSSKLLIFIGIVGLLGTIPFLGIASIVILVLVIIIVVLVRKNKKKKLDSKVQIEIPSGQSDSIGRFYKEINTSSSTIADQQKKQENNVPLNSPKEAPKPVPKKATVPRRVCCPNCGATTIPINGCCEYCDGLIVKN